MRLLTASRVIFHHRIITFNIDSANCRLHNLIWGIYLFFSFFSSVRCSTGALCDCELPLPAGVHCDQQRAFYHGFMKARQQLKMPGQLFSFTGCCRLTVVTLFQSYHKTSSFPHVLSSVITVIDYFIVLLPRIIDIINNHAWIIIT